MFVGSMAGGATLGGASLPRHGRQSSGRLGHFVPLPIGSAAGELRFARSTLQPWQVWSELGAQFPSISFRTYRAQYKIGGLLAGVVRWTRTCDSRSRFLRCSPAEFEVGPDRSYRDRRFDASTFHLINIKSCVGCGACGYVGEGEHFPAFRACSGSGEAQPVGEADRPHIHRPSW
jgi:hypothetical protein